MRVLFEPDFRDKAKASGKVVYVSLHGNSIAVDCYSFEGSDGAFRCFDPKAGSETSGGESRPSSLGNSGATSVGGILAPIKGAPITSLFGLRFHPILHILRLHAGIDFGAPVGSLVRAAADGKVEIAGPVSGFGNHVRVQHAGFETSYSHLSEIPEAIHPGVEVKQGDIIALSGNTGLSTGPHLALRVLSEPRRRRSPAPSGLRASDRGGVAEGPRHRDRGSLGVGAKRLSRRDRRLSRDQGLSRPGDREPRELAPRHRGCDRFGLATACSSPPAGRARWTLELLAEALVKVTTHESLSRETVRRRLAENKLKPWRKDMWRIPQGRLRRRRRRPLGPPQV